MVRKTPTACCALCQISKVTNNTPIETIKARIRLLEKQKYANTEVGYSYGDGQTSVFVIVSPGEDTLEKNLQVLGFKYIHSFERRVGYPKEGDLKMYILNF